MFVCYLVNVHILVRKFAQKNLITLKIIKLYILSIVINQTPKLFPFKLSLNYFWDIQHYKLKYIQIIFFSDFTIEKEKFSSKAIHNFAEFLFIMNPYTQYLN